jgi:hypothetical protein
MKKDIRPRPNIKFQLVSPESDHEESSHIHDKAYGKCIFTRLSLRIQLLNDRFTIKEIDDILEEIQEEVLPYDNYSSILSKIQLQQHKLSNQELDSKTESTQDSSSFSQLTGFSPPETSSVFITQKGIEKDEDISSSSDEMDNAFEYFEPVDRSQASPRMEPQLCTFPELHLVAKQENLEVATYIVFSWINEDAEKDDVSVKNLKISASKFNFCQNTSTWKSIQAYLIPFLSCRCSHFVALSTLFFCITNTLASVYHRNPRTK